MRTVLVVDDNPAVGQALEVLFGLRDIRTLRALSPAEALRRLAGEPVELVIADMNFHADTTSGDEGVALFREIHQRYPDLPVVLLTAWTNLETAIDLVKGGAADYLPKPWDDRKLLATVERLLEQSEAASAARRRGQERQRRRAQLSTNYDLCGIVYAADASERAIELACHVAKSSLPVLITGPNGVGKERVAAIVHANSGRGGPFVPVNCGALPADLVEAELFGADAGAFTGASRSREGRFESADGGTLFLDEIGNLPLAGQAKLLRVLETGDFQRLGSTQLRHADVRVVAATNADLPTMIRAGRFREDLFYRLNVIEIKLPPLSERREDILALAEAFLGDGVTLADEAREALLAHGWPGNVRELKNVLERARLLSRDHTIRVEDLALPAVASRTAVKSVDVLDRAMIEAALGRAGGVVSRAAAELGLSRQALYRRMERFGIAGDDEPRGKP